MSGTVWTKFFWSDWANDPALRLCSLSSQGLWMRMLCVAAEADPTGYVTVNGRPLGVTDIARLAGVTETECESLLSELDRNGVFSRTRNGVIYSRRMVRDMKTAKKNRENGKKGGNPSLRNNTEKILSVNPPDNHEVKAHKPIANSQESSSSARERRSPITARHRVIAANLLDRGKADLSPWEARFLTDLIGKTVISAKMQATLDAIAAKVGINAETVMATWRHRIDTARQLSQWDVKWGPMPGKLGCLAPDEMLQPGDGDGWTEWRAAS